MKAQGWEPGIPDGFSCLSHQGPVTSCPGVSPHPQQYFVGSHLKQAGVWKCCEAPGITSGLDASALPTERSAGEEGQELSLLLVSSAAASPLNSSCSDQPGLDPSELLRFHPWSSGKAVCALQVCDRVVSARPAHTGPFSPCPTLTSKTPRFSSESDGFCPFLGADAANSPQIFLKFRVVRCCLPHCPSSVLLLTVCSPLR